MAQRTSAGRVSVCPPDHQHGARATCLKDHRCACQPCQDADNERTRYWRRQKAYGRVYRVPVTGVRRRIEALYTLGWSTVRIGQELGCKPATIQRWLQGDAAFVRKETHDRMADLYERLWNQPPSSDTWAERVGIGRTLAFARRQGFQPPLAWDDIDRDPEPPAFIDWEGRDVDMVAVERAMEPDGDAEGLNAAERSALAELAVSRGWTHHGIYKRFGISAQRASKRVREQKAA